MSTVYVLLQFENKNRLKLYFRKKQALNEVGYKLATLSQNKRLHTYIFKFAENSLLYRFEAHNMF